MRSVLTKLSAVVLCAAGIVNSSAAAVFTVETVSTGGFVDCERVNIFERNGCFCFAWPRDKMPKGTKSVTVTPDFATAICGDAGW